MNSQNKLCAQAPDSACGRKVESFYNGVNRVALNIKNREVERLAEEVAGLASETKTEAIRRALEERRARLALRIPKRVRDDAVRRFLEREVWPHVPPGVRGRRTSRQDREEILGYSGDGV